jgi:hydroxymethylbilane synthase
LQLKKISRNIDVVNIRGNVDTRIKKLEDKEFDAIILAAAGVKSLNLKNKISLFFKTSEILPAVGQGIVALQCRKNDKLTLDIINKINDKDSSLCAIAERTMLKTIGGDCETAVGGFAKITNNILKLQAQLFSDDGKNCYNFEFSGRGDEAVKIGKKVGIKLLSLAGDKYKKK